MYIFRFDVFFGFRCEQVRTCSDGTLEHLKLSHIESPIHQLLSRILVLDIAANINVQSYAILKLTINQVSQDKLDDIDRSVSVLTNLAHPERDLSFIIGCQYGKNHC